jgi:HAD superfamily hydrolase (TIGR01509 family)
MNHKKIKAIIFDCDGTLVNSEAPTAKLITEILLSNGYQTNFSEILSISQGEKLAKLADKLMTKFEGLNPRQFIHAYNHKILEKLKSDLAPDQATIGVIQNLPLPKCVATNGSLERTEIALEASGLLRFFKGLIVSGHDIKSWKPDPKIIQHSAALLNVEPQECLLIDDSIDGLKAGLSAGAQVASFRISDQKLGDLKKSVRPINDLAEIFQLI